MSTKNWKRIISMMLCIALLAGNLPAVFAAETSGTCGENLIWILDKEGILTISGTGPMWNYGYQNYAPWHARYGEVKTIIIKDGVTGIGKAAFYECTVATMVDIPESVTSIGSNAFSYCFSLTSIDIPEGVTSIDGSTFTSCYSLTSIDIPDGVTSIGRSAFNGCSGLTNIDIPDGVTSIDDYVFNECRSLTSITVPCNVSSIGVGAFAYCTGLTSVAIPGKVTSIGDNAFLYCNALIDVYYEKTTSEWIQLSNRPKGQNLRIHYSCTDSANHWKTETVAPTCGKQGHSYEICSCNSPYERNWQDLSATGNHIYDQQKPEEQYLVTAATCTEKAVYHFSCACGEEGTETFEYGNVKPHTYESKVTPPTCTEGGYTTHTCAACGDTYTDTETAALGHDWKDTGCTRCDESRENPFVDVPENSFFIGPVLWAVEKGITNGVDATHFGPDANCMRAAVVTFLWRAAGEPEPTSANNPFTDVKESDYFYKAVLWAVEKGITNGMTATTFGPTAQCNRAQVVTFLWRAMGKPATNATEHPFTDVDEGQFYFEPMLWAVENGITNGLTATTFGPGNICNRAQVVTFLYRAYNK